ncbi:MAG: crossover junction endodeoxyribonuclease RuvC [Acidobacteriota bacterium]
MLGLDPGSRFTGWGVVDCQGSRLRPISHGRFALASAGELPRRLARLDMQVRGLIAEHAPDVAALESLFHGVNPRSLIVLAQARGVLLAALALAEVDVREYSPAQIKTSVTGFGRADKDQVGRMVRQILGLRSDELSPDAADALAAAICLGQRARLDAFVAQRPASALR